MLGLDDLNAEMAACWKFVWNVEPAALIVPLAEAALLDGALAGALPLPDGLELGGVELDEEEHAARDSAIATRAPPAATTCCLRRSCISGILLMGFTHVLGRVKQPVWPFSL